MKFQVGVLAARYNYYAIQRNVVDIVEGVEYLPVWDIFSLLNWMKRKVNAKTKRTWFSTFDSNNVFYDANLNKVDILHLWNGVSLGKIPWVTTFETLLPRYASVLRSFSAIRHWRDIKSNEWLIKVSLDALAGDACKGVIAMSESAHKIQNMWLQACPEYAHSIQQKMYILHPPQNTVLETFLDKEIDVTGTIRFMLVGAHFFRKGGLEVLETFEKLRAQYHYPLELVVVSSLDANDYVFQNDSYEKVEYAKRIIARNSDWITHYPRLENRDVLHLMRGVHVGLLPTYADTYGYSVLEFQSMGCPVITTDVRALPEINNSDVGWVISVPKNELREGLYKTPDERLSMSQSIREGLEYTLHTIFSKPSIIIQKGNAAIARIKREHSPEKYQMTLREIYGLDN